MGKRGHGEGSIYRRKDGRWAASITLENHRRKTFYGKTRKQVQEKLKVAQHEQQQGMLTSGRQQTLRAYLEHWLEEVHRLTIHTSTYVEYHTSLLKNPLKDEPIMLAGHIQQEIKKVHEGLEIVGLLEGLAHFE